MSPEHEAVTKARNSKDVRVLITCLAIIAATVIVVIGGALLIASLQVSGLIDSPVDETGAPIGSVWELVSTVLGYGMIIVAILAFTMITIRMMRQMNLGNALQVEYSDYAWLRDWANKVAADLQVPRVEIFVTQDPVINAYAFGFAKPYNIVLHSGSIRYLSREELKTVVVHEMAHVKYHHTQIGTYLTPLRSFPLAGAFFGWILDFWSRRAELTADRLALTYLKNPSLVKDALVKVHVGPDVATGFNNVARQWQARNASSSFNSFTQTFASHPFLVRRLKHIDDSTYLIAQPASAPTMPTASV